MLIGESRRRLQHHHHHLHHNNNTPWLLESSPPITNYAAFVSSLRRNLFPASDQLSGKIVDYFPVEADFYMYEFKVMNCTRARAHDWTECHFCHPGEKARRRDPRIYKYAGNSCPEFRKGSCKKGDSCEFAHGVFESWLHPTRFRTQACKDGSGCTRRVCFFAHSPNQLRTGSDPNLDDEVGGLLSALTMRLSLKELNKKVNPLVNKPRPVGSGPSLSPVFCSPTGPTGFIPPRLESIWEEKMERVESGREVRARMFEKLSKENSFNEPGLGSGPAQAYAPGPDFGWVFDLIT